MKWLVDSNKRDFWMLYDEATFHIAANLQKLPLTEFEPHVLHILKKIHPYTNRLNEEVGLGIPYYYPRGQQIDLQTMLVFLRFLFWRILLFFITIFMQRFYFYCF